jgi:hypothetical protein
MNNQSIHQTNLLKAYSVLESEAVVVRYVKNDQVSAEETKTALTAALPVITGYFELQSPLPRLTAILVPSRDEYDRLVLDLLGVDIEIPSNPARIAQPQRTDLVLLSPSAYEKHSAFTFSRSSYRRLLTHELVHIVEEHLSPDIELLPQWWSEGLAVYLSGQWRWEESFRQPPIDGIEAGQIPPISKIEASRKLGYEWGWTIIRHIDEQHGQSTVVRIVTECANGDVFATLGTKKELFESEWKTALVRREKDKEHSD